MLLSEVLATLQPGPGEVALDCTAGLGGHAEAIARRLGPSGVVVLNDVDPGNLDRAAARVGALAGAPRVIPIRGNFADAPRRLASAGVRASVVLADLGFSSNQMEDAGRGLSFSRDGPLDMRLDPSLGTTAADLVRSLPEEELARVIREFGEDRLADRIARKIAAERGRSPITTTGQLAEIVRSAVGSAAGRDTIHPATRTFQALRIAVNDELGGLEAFLHWVSEVARHKGGDWLTPRARVGIISFHSLEDRLVKRAFGELARAGLARDLTSGVAAASRDEVERNPRSRSAKFRAIALIGEG